MYKNLLTRLNTVVAENSNVWRVPGRLVYVVSHSYPYSSNGYAVRTHSVASALVQHGHSVVVINRPGRPWDLPGFTDTSFPLHQEIDGVLYVNIPFHSARGMVQTDYLAAAAAALKDVINVFKPSAVMAASNYEHALPAGIAARELGLPFYYEVRGFWEITRASQDSEWKNCSEYKTSVEIEAQVAKSADRVFTLNNFMHNELVNRGVRSEVIEILPNAYGALPDMNVSSKLSKESVVCNTRYVVGYVGSFSDYEGLDDLVHACAQLRKNGIDLSLLMVGSSGPLGIAETTEQCPASAALQQLARELGFEAYLKLTGRVAQEALADYYAVIDLVVIPRKPVPVCDLVSPIKPLEAAAFGKAMLVSDVAPLKEMVEESMGAAAFKAGDVADLAVQIAQLLSDDARRSQLAQAALIWVSEQRSWSQVITKVSQSKELAMPPKLAARSARVKF